ncbi:MAG: hypothetical protein ACREV9_12505 [Burkholderiales bacterium]
MIALRFYSAVLGQTVKEEDFPGGAIGVFPHVEDDCGGCLFVSSDERPSDHGAPMYFNCDGRLDDAIGAVEENCGKIIKAKHSIMPNGMRAIVLDSEGDRIALHSK